MSEAQLRFSNSFLFVLVVMFAGNILFYLYNQAADWWYENKMKKRRQDVLAVHKEKYRTRMEALMRRLKSGRMNDVVMQAKNLKVRRKTQSEEEAKMVIQEKLKLYFERNKDKKTFGFDPTPDYLRQDMAEKEEAKATEDVANQAWGMLGQVLDSTSKKEETPAEEVKTPVKQ